MTPVPCGSCDAPVIWTKTERGNRMPVDATPNPRGNILLQDGVNGEPPVAYYLRGVEKQVILDNAPDETDFYVSHFSSCPHAAFHRRKK